MSTQTFTKPKKLMLTEAHQSVAAKLYTSVQYRFLSGNYQPIIFGSCMIFSRQKNIEDLGICHFTKIHRPIIFADFGVE